VKSLALLCLPLAACQVFFGGNDDEPADAATVPDVRPFPDGGNCGPMAQAFAPDPSPHVDEGTAVTYSTNPPSSGPHYPRWARWDMTYGPGVLARPYWVHNLEHGGVVFLVSCPGGCPEVVQQLEALQASLPKDPKCAGLSTPTRTLISSDELLPAGVQVAAAAWGATYVASCFDEPTLRTFYMEHFGKAPENFCTNGNVP
jgi:Protein of unknown function (DUF3105)